VTFVVGYWRQFSDIASCHDMFAADEGDEQGMLVVSLSPEWVASAAEAVHTTFGIGNRFPRLGSVYQARSTYCSGSGWDGARRGAGGASSSPMTGGAVLVWVSPRSLA
jgi:hypothetical protein